MNIKQGVVSKNKCYKDGEWGFLKDERMNRTMLTLNLKKYFFPNDEINDKEEGYGIEGIVTVRYSNKILHTCDRLLQTLKKLHVTSYFQKLSISLKSAISNFQEPFLIKRHVFICLI